MMTLDKLMRRNRFLSDYTPAKLEEELNNYVVGQPELVRAVADFLYYHMMRQSYPALPARSLLIAGSSGTGKTEVFRRVSELYGDILNIKIVDGSRITKEGWSGSQKLEGVLSKDLDILVVDEMDKLCTPSYSTGGANVSKELQGEFLKLMEGEFEVKERRGGESYVVKGVSVVLVGAFESIREEKKHKANNFLGFGMVEPEIRENVMEIADEDFIRFGMIPELLGRVSKKVVTNDLSDQNYLEILKNPHGRVSTLLDVLHNCGVERELMISDEEILEMVNRSKENRTGFRWVSAQVENHILEAIRESGVGAKHAEDVPNEMQEVPEEEELWTPDDDFFDV